MACAHLFAVVFVDGVGVMLDGAALGVGVGNVEKTGEIAVPKDLVFFDVPNPGADFRRGQGGLAANAGVRHFRVGACLDGNIFGVSKQQMRLALLIGGGRRNFHLPEAFLEAAASFGGAWNVVPVGRKTRGFAGAADALQFGEHSGHVVGRRVVGIRRKDLEKALAEHGVAPGHGHPLERAVDGDEGIRVLRAHHEKHLRGILEK